MDPAPEHPPEQPKPASATRTWLRILAWITPGVAAPGWLLGWFILSYSNQRHTTAISIGAITLLIMTVLGCAFFNAILRPSSHLEDPAEHTKSIVLSVVVFTLIQIIIAPAIGFAVATACNLVT